MAPPAPGPAGPSTCFYGCQTGGKSVINYSYTDMPWRLLAYDVYYFFHFAWAIPYIIFPIDKPGSGALDELSPTRQNLFCVAVHFVLSILQLAFILLVLPLCIILPVWTALIGAGLFILLNNLVCDTLLNGRQDTYISSPEYAPELPEHAHEQWIFLNGVAVGQHWLQGNLDRLALTFRRPVLGIHNKTRGIIFDVVECLIQRSFGYSTRDVRICYGIVKEKLYDPKYSKVVFIQHSQGGIEGSMVLDWLLQELPQDLLAKLEVYTFGNAANHFNNPHRHIDSQKSAKANPGSAAIDVADPLRANGHRSPSSPSSTSSAATTKRRQTQPPTKGRSSILMRETSAPHPSDVSGRAIGHIEHYAHTTDFVALWGVLHFATTAPETKLLPRFMGRVFARTSDRGGHQFCFHYLDGMFPLEQALDDDSSSGADDPATRFVGCARAGFGEGENSFMMSEVVLGRDGDEAAAVRAAFDSSWIGVALGDSNGGEGDQNGGADGGDPVTTVHSSSPVLSRSHSRQVVRVKDLSRLWQYRDGRSPDETPSSLGKDADGVVRGKTM